MGTLKNFMLGLLLATVLMGPAAWAEAGHLVRAGLSAATEQLGQPAHASAMSATVSPALLHAR